MNVSKQPAKDFRGLIVWQKAHQLVLAVYKVTKNFPKEEMFGLTSQMRRAMVSVAANIAEAFKKKGVADKLRILNISQGSLSEVQYYLILCDDLQYCNTGELMNQAEEVSRLLESYMKAIRTNSKF